MDLQNELLESGKHIKKAAGKPRGLPRPSWRDHRADHLHLDPGDAESRGRRTNRCTRFCRRMRLLRRLRLHPHRPRPRMRPRHRKVVKPVQVHATDVRAAARDPEGSPESRISPLQRRRSRRSIRLPPQPSNDPPGAQEGGVPGGVVGGVVGGQQGGTVGGEVGGQIGGVLGGEKGGASADKSAAPAKAPAATSPAPPPPPPAPEPKDEGPLRVGGDVKAPVAINAPNPTTPMPRAKATSPASSSSKRSSTSRAKSSR